MCVCACVCIRDSHTYSMCSCAPGACISARVCVCAFLCVSQHRCMLVCENHLHAVFSVGLQSVSLVRAVIPDEALFISPASVSERGVNTWRSQNPLAAACEHKMLCFMTAGAKKKKKKYKCWIILEFHALCIDCHLHFMDVVKNEIARLRACFSLTLIQLSGKRSGTFNYRSPVMQKQMSHRDRDFYSPGFLR